MLLEIEKIKFLIKNGEKIDVEFKRAKREVPQSIFKTVCAFNNRVGGHIFFGVEDDKTIVGVDKDYADTIMKEFSNTINNPQLMWPPLYAEPRKVDIDGKTVIYIYIPEGREVCRYKNIFWDRSFEGDIDVSKNQELLFQLMRRKNRSTIVDKVYPELGVEYLEEELIKRAIKWAVSRDKNHSWKGMSTTEFLQHNGLMAIDVKSKKHGITLASILLFGSDYMIKSFLPHYKTDAIFRVQNLDRYDDREIVATNLIDSYYKLVEFGKKHLNDVFVLDGMVRVSARDNILREIISNMLCHRDYSSYFPAQFVIEKDKMYTENSNIPYKMGNLFSLKSFQPFPKNPAISRIFREIGLADELGSGMRNSYKYSMLYSGKEPIFLDADIFKTIIPLENIATEKVGGRKKDIAKEGKSERAKEGKSERAKEGKSERAKEEKSERAKEGKSERAKERKKEKAKERKKERRKKNVAKIEGTGSFKIINTDTQLKSILEYANLHKEFRRVDIENILSIKTTRASELIRTLIKDNKIESVGNGNKRRYRIIK